MIAKGQTLTNPVTGERMTFVETAADTDGEYVVIELSADPGGAVAAAHVHPSQWETFEVVSGTLGAKVGGRKVKAGPGETLEVEPGRRTPGGTPVTTSSSSGARSARRSSSSR